MKSYTYTINIHPADPDETGFWVEVPALPGCVTQGETYEEAVSNAEEAIQVYLEALIRRGDPIPEESQLPLVVGVRVELPQAV